MRTVFETGTILILAVFVLAACGSADKTASNANSDARVRLSANKSSAQIGDFEILVNAMSTADLTPEVAQGYDIIRSENQGMVNLVLIRKAADNTATPISGKVLLSASNLTGQLKNMELREIVDGPSIYYIGVVVVDNRETINFDFDVQPEGSNQVLLIRFTHEFFTK
jgi:hypothetical protein